MKGQSGGFDVIRVTPGRAQFGTLLVVSGGNGPGDHLLIGLHISAGSRLGVDG